MKVGPIIKKARQRMGLTLSDLANLTGSSISTLSAVENDKQQNQLTPGDMVAISDATRDREMLSEYCFLCPIRSRIIIRKFQPLNNILPGAHVSMLKVLQKLSEASNALEAMLPKMLRQNFDQDPDYLEYRNTTILKGFDVQLGIQTMFEQLRQSGVVTADDLKLLQDVHHRLCEEKGHRLPEKAQV